MLVGIGRKLKQTMRLSASKKKRAICCTMSERITDIIVEKTVTNSLI